MARAVTHPSAVLVLCMCAAMIATTSAGTTVNAATQPICVNSGSDNMSQFVQCLSKSDDAANNGCGKSLVVDGAHLHPEHDNIGQQHKLDRLVDARADGDAHAVRHAVLSRAVAAVRPLGRHHTGRALHRRRCARLWLWRVDGDVDVLGCFHAAHAPPQRNILGAVELHAACIPAVLGSLRFPRLLFAQWHMALRHGKRRMARRLPLDLCGHLLDGQHRRARLPPQRHHGRLHVHAVDSLLLTRAVRSNRHTRRQWHVREHDVPGRAGLRGRRVASPHARAAAAEQVERGARANGGCRCVLL
eukprot:Opistho-1_new@30936